MKQTPWTYTSEWYSFWSSLGWLRNKWNLQWPTPEFLLLSVQSCRQVLQWKSRKKLRCVFAYVRRCEFVKRVICLYIHKFNTWVLFPYLKTLFVVGTACKISKFERTTKNAWKCLMRICWPILCLKRILCKATELALWPPLAVA
jgi:hypothetical protein